MASCPRAPWLTLLVAASACATPLAPEHEARNRELLRVAQECQRSLPGIVAVDLQPDGRVQVAYKDSRAESFRPFGECYNPKAGPLLYAKGRLAETSNLPARDYVLVQARGGGLLVDVVVNDAPLTLFLDTGASVTVINTGAAAAAGLRPSRGSYPIELTVAGGKRADARLVRAKRVGLGAHAVEDIDVAVYDVVPGGYGVDGLLGADVLRFFRFTIRPDSGLLILERIGAAEEEPRPAPSPDDDAS